MDKKKVFFLVILIVFSLNPFAIAKINASGLQPPSPNILVDDEINPEYPGWDLQRKIAIFYDPDSSILMDLALHVYDSTSIVYHNSHFIALDTWDKFVTAVESDDYWIKLYFVDGDLEGLNFDVSRNWTEVANTLTNGGSNSHHIFGSGSTNLLQNAVASQNDLPVNIHIEGSDIIDTENSYFYYLWEVGEIFSVDSDMRYQMVSEDFRVLGIRYFGENLGNLVNNQFEPVAPLGIEDVEAKKQGWEDELESMNTIHQVLPNNEIRTENSTEPVPDTSIVFLDKKNSNTNALSLNQEEPEFTIADIPFASGLEGPAQKIVDTVLELLIKFGGSALGLSEDAAFEIVNSMKQIGLLLADSTDGEGDVDTTLKSLLLSLGDLVPIPDKLKEFFPLFVDAFFLIRGDIEDIVTFSQTLISTIFGQVADMNSTQSTGIQAMLSVLEEVLLNGADLVQRIAEAKTAAAEKGESFELFTEIQSFIFERLLNFTTYEWLAQILGDTNSALAQEGAELMKLLIPIVKAMVKGDYSDLIGEIPTVVSYIVSKVKKSNHLAQGLSLDSLTIYQADTKTSSAIKIITRLYEIGMHLYKQYGDLGGNIVEAIKSGKDTDADTIRDLLANLLLAAQGLLFGEDDTPFSEETIKEFATNIFKVYTDASTLQIDSEANLKTLLTDVFTLLNLPTTSDEGDLLLDALILFGSIIIPTIPAPFGAEFKNLGLRILDVALSSVVDSDLVKESVFTLIDVVFGLIAILDVGGPAQQLFVDGPEDFDEDGKITANAKLRIVENFTNRTFTLFSSFIGEYFNDSSTLQSYVKIFQNTFVTLITIITSSSGGSIQSILQAVLLQGIELYLSEVWGIDSTIIMKLLTGLFDGLFGGEGGKTIGNVIGDAITEDDAVALVTSILEGRGNSQSTIDLMEFAVRALFDLENLFTNILEFIINSLKSALISFLTSLITKLTNRISSFIDGIDILKFAGTIGFPGADFIGLELSFDLSIAPNLKWDNEGFVQWVMSLIFDGLNDLAIPNIGEIFKKLLSFLSITPIFSASFGVSSMSSGKGGLFSTILGALGADLSFSGEIHFVLQLLAFNSGGFDPDGFIKLLEWGLSITIILSRDFTLFDIATGGAGGSALNKAAKYIGLELITITIYVGFTFEIVQKAAHNGSPAQGSLALSLLLGASIYVGISLAIVELGIAAGIDITLKFFQDLTPGALNPFKITLDIVFWVKVTLKFLFWDWDKKFTFRPPGSPYDLTPKSLAETKKNAFGFDSDNDGLSDDLELGIPSADPNLADTDGDRLSDKFELYVSKTDIGKFDTDGDGLSDFDEWYRHNTDPLVEDTDREGLTDFEEVAVYGTDPLSQDTDGDLLNDHWEVTTAIDISLVTPSVTSVIIGNVEYNDHTDPLNPDTDDDLLLDGEESEFGMYWGSEDNYDGPNPILIFNEGYTHPLDNDTDDDSYAQLHTGITAGEGPSRIYYRDMRDGIEIQGIRATVVVADDDGTRELVSKVFHTNPTNPDSDGDTGGVSDPRVDTGGYYIFSDGLELILDPASDPLDSDSDDDGLIDGLEGTTLPNREVTTDINNADTDGDSLPDGLEITLGSDPGNPDTDNDLVLDGDEFFLFHTSPLNPDTDFDGVDDGWELYFSHSNPHSKDSDGDGLSDYEEIFIFGTNPVDEDSDNDSLPDKDEVLEYETDPTNADSDGDGLRDSEEIQIYETDPNNADTDGDSILYVNENGDPTFLWNDGQEVAYGTSPRSQDSDDDGILDSWELYIAEGEIPNFENVPLDPLNNDTDGDGLIDGKELQVDVAENLIYPYIAIQTSYPFGSSPVDDDTDDDRLNDKFEVDRNMRADTNDTDGDTLSDWDELFVHLTDPTKEDTDGDGLTDAEEVTAAFGNSTLSLTAYNPSYATNALESDSDFDGWPDGLEINGSDNYALYNPYDPDVNDNDIPDGYERDFDNDGISDGDEYYRYNSEGSEDGGFLDYRNPDSDFDGFTDGDEVLIYGTKPYNPDTDFDTYSDSLEVWVGTDPLVFTTEEEMLGVMSRMNSPIQIRSPENGRNYGDGKIDVEIFPTVDIKDAYFRYRAIDSNTSLTVDKTWVGNYSLDKDFKVPFRPQTWSSDKVNFKKGFEYELEVWGLVKKYHFPASPDRELRDVWLRNVVRFTVNGSYFLGISPENWKIIGGATAFISVAAIAILIKRGVIKPRKIYDRLRRRKST